MKSSIISLTVVFLFFAQNINYCNSLPVIVVIGLTSSLLSIGRFLWQTGESLLEKSYLQKSLLSSNKSVRESFSRDLILNSRARFPESSQSVKAEENYIEVDNLISKIEHFYNDMERYNESLVSNSFNGSYDVMKSEARNNLSKDVHRPMGLMRSIYELVIAKDVYSIFNSLQLRFLEGYLDTCSNGNDMNSAQKYILDYLTLITAAGTKVFMTVQIASEILRTTANETYTSDVESISDELNQKHNSMMNTYMKLLKEASREVWRCDPSSHVEDITYTKLNNVFNIFITNEKNLAYNEECSKECGSLNPRSWNPCKDEIFGLYCPGLLWDCKTGFVNIDLFKKLQVCQLNPNSSRRYDYADLVSKELLPDFKEHYGQKENCDNGTIQSMELEYPLMTKCDICVCTSDNDKEYNKTDTRRTERFFYSQPVFTDIFDNYVMTGVRLAKKDGIVFFEIQQGKLSSIKTIDPSSVSWKTIEKENLYNSSNLLKLQWNHKSIELQDIEVPQGHILVGLQMDKISDTSMDNSISDRISLKVLSLPIDFVNLKVNFTYNRLVDNITYTSPVLSKTGLNLENHNLPDPKVKSNKTITNQYLQFSTSSMIHDVGQTTIPLLDIQNVTTTIPTLMGGAGLYFKYTREFEGYLAIKLKTYDFTQHSNSVSENF